MGKPVQARDARKLSGFKYFDLIGDLFERLRPVGTARDRAGNRQLFFDQYAALLLLYYFNPTVTTLRGLQQFTSLGKVQRLLGVRPTSLGSLSEAARVFDAQALEPIIADLAARATREPAGMPSAKEAALAGLIAVDGSLLPALPRMAWALWRDETHRAAKMHMAFAVFPGVPVEVSVTAGTHSKRTELRRFVQRGGFYVFDRGYADYAMFRAFDEAGAKFVGRIQENTAFDVREERTLTETDRAAGVVRDVTVKRLGTEKHNPWLRQPMRIVQVRGSEPGHVWILATNQLDLPADLIALAYRYRWQIELFFRWMKCVLGCRHLLSDDANGVTLQVYCAVIASLLLALWTGAKPGKRTFEMLCHYLSGWATAEEVEHHLKSLPPATGPPSKL